MVESRVEEGLMYHTLATFVSTGVGIEEAITLTGKAHPRYEEPLRHIHDRMLEGSNFVGPMRERNLSFSSLAIMLTEVGEETGDLDGMLYKASELVIEKAKLGSKQEHRFNEFLFYRSLGILFEAGLPAVKALNRVSKISPHPQAEIISDMAADIERGATLSEAMRKKDKYFNEGVCSLISAGEVGDVIGVVCNKIADNLQLRYRLSN